MMSELGFHVPLSLWCERANARIGEMETSLAEREREAVILLDAIFQTVDPEDGEEIVADAFPKGCPAWVLAWYQEHPNEEELAARAARAEEGSGK